MRIHLVDGTFELFRCFSATPRASNDYGEEVGASRGLVHTLVALLRQPGTTHVAITFDTIVDAPLAGTEGDGPWAQHSIAADIVRALGLVIWPMIRRYEADDALATAALRFAGDPRVDQVLICTRDKDLAQCVSGDRIVMLDRVNNVEIDEQAVIVKWGVRPAQIPDYLALVGDKSDGLPGIPGWGHVAASAVLRRYGSIEQIPEESWDVEVRGADRLAATLASRRLEALLYRDLIELSTDVPLRETVDDLQWRGADRSRLESVCARIGARDVLDRVPLWASGGAPS